MNNTIQNFQIPVSDFERALEFYNTLMGYKLQTMEYQGAKLGIFRCELSGGVGGNIIKSEGLIPSSKGTIVYLHTGKDLNPFLTRMALAGGKTIFQKTPLGPDMGFFAIFKDTEGNHVGLYSKN
ncbi:MAG: VOC family protein [Bacteroidota bacterium]